MSNSHWLVTTGNAQASIWWPIPALSDMVYHVTMHDSIQIKYMTVLLNETKCVLYDYVQLQYLLI